jgi:ethanolamine utilization protein EutQ (cupin superfamily)
MNVSRFSVTDASFEEAPQGSRIYAGNVVDERHGGDITVGYGRWEPGSTLDQTMEVDDVMIILEGGVSVTADGQTSRAGAGDIVYMPKGRHVTIQADLDLGARTAFVTYPHWRTAG